MKKIRYLFEALFLLIILMISKILPVTTDLDHICRDRLTFIGADKFPDDRDQPIMTFSGHLANWEVMPGALLHHANFPVHSIYRAPNNPKKYNEGIEIDFLGKPAMTSPIFAQLAKKYNCPLYPVSVKRLNGPNFEVTLHDPLRIDDKTNEQIVAESHEYLKTWIFENPEQWLWLHNRWIGKNRRLRKNQKAKIK